MSATPPEDLPPHDAVPRDDPAGCTPDPVTTDYEEPDHDGRGPDGSGSVRYRPDPSAVPNPHVPPRLRAAADGPSPMSSNADLDEILAALPPSSRSWWTLQRLGVVLVGIGIVAVLTVGLLFWLSIQAYQKQRATPSDVEVRTAVVDAARQMTAYRQENGAFPTDLGQIRSPGYAPDPKVRLTLLPVPDPEADFCLAAGPPAGAPSMWFSGSAGPMDQPCG